MYTRVKNYADAYSIIKRPYVNVYSADIVFSAKFMVYYETCDEVLPHTVENIKIFANRVDLISHEAFMRRIDGHMKIMQRKFDGPTTCCINHELMEINSIELDH